MNKKKDIKVGDIIVCKNGFRYVCINDKTFVNNDGYLHIDEFDNKLNNTSVDSFSIQRIYRPHVSDSGCFGIGFNNLLTMKVWDYDIVYDKNTINISLTALKQLLIDKYKVKVNIFDDETGKTLFTADTEIYNNK